MTANNLCVRGSYLSNILREFMLESHLCEDVSLQCQAMNQHYSTHDTSEVDNWVEIKSLIKF